MCNRSERVAAVDGTTFMADEERDKLRGQDDPNMRLLGEPLSIHPAIWSTMPAGTTVKVAYAKSKWSKVRHRFLIAPWTGGAGSDLHHHPPMADFS